MPGSGKARGAKRRVKVQNLPPEEETLTATEKKKVGGGATVQGGIYPVKTSTLTDCAHGCPACPHPAKLS